MKKIFACGGFALAAIGCSQERGTPQIQSPVISCQPNVETNYATLQTKPTNLLLEHRTHNFSKGFYTELEAQLVALRVEHSFVQP